MSTLLAGLLLQDAVGKYSPDQPRDDHGRWSNGGGGSAASQRGLSDRAARALRTHVAIRASEQRKAEHTEAQLAKALGLKQTGDNSAFDLKGAKVGVEVKTFLSTKNDKITMHGYALGRKVSEARAERLKTYTVVADKRGGATKFYISNRLGSLRLSTMTRVTLSEMRAMVRGRR